MSQTCIVNPIKGKNSENLGNVAVMVSSQPDLFALVSKLGINKDDYSHLLMSRLYKGKGKFNNMSVVGPFIGAPYATILLENLIIRGVKKVIFFGWCGAVSKNVKIGDIILPTSAYIDEGTSAHYLNIPNNPTPLNTTLHNHTYNDYALEKHCINASFELSKKIEVSLIEEKINYHKGSIWTTDAIFRETHEKVISFMKKGVLAVEMELSAIFSVGKFRNIETCGLLAVSDEISSLKWNQGFSNKKFKKTRGEIISLIARVHKKITCTS